MRTVWWRGESSVSALVWESIDAPTQNHPNAFLFYMRLPDAIPTPSAFSTPTPVSVDLPTPECTPCAAALLVSVRSLPRCYPHPSALYRHGAGRVLG